MRSLSLIITLCVVSAARAAPPPAPEAPAPEAPAPDAPAPEAPATDAPAPEAPAPEANQCPATGCSAPSCRKLVYEMIRDVDETADPCDDFNQYACGNWEKAHAGRFAMAFINAGLPVKKIVLDLLQQGQSDNILSLPGKFYGACVDASRGSVQAWQKTVGDVFAEFGGWPLPCDAQVPLDLAPLMVKATTLRGNGILDLVPEVRQVNGSKKLVLKVKRYSVNRLDRIELYRHPLPSYITEYVAAELRDFSRKLQTALGPRQPRYRFRTFDETTERLYKVDEFKEKFKLDIIDELVTETASLYGVPELGDLQLTVEERLEPYLSNLTGVLSTVSKRIQFNYILYHTFFGLPWLIPPSTERCLQQVRRGLPLALNRLFAEKVFTQEYTDGFATLERYIRGAYTELFSKTAIGNADDKKFLLEKLKSIKISHGYSRSLFDDELITSYFSALGELGDNYIKNAIHVWLFGRGKRLQIQWAPEKLKGLQHDLASLGGLSVPAMNAHYVPSDNRIFMAPALLKAFYRKDGPMSHNFGQVGYVLGHEIGHAFDNNGIKTSKDGRLRDTGYISQTATEQYLSITSCLEDRYQGVANTSAMGIFQLIADNLGVFTAYKGYKQWLSDVPERADNDQLPFLEMSGEQVFFTASARTWCNTPGQSPFSTGSYSFATMRILISAMNNEGFGKAFQCSSDARMNPPECVYFR